jgi:hypothetical protein
MSQPHPSARGRPSRVVAVRVVPIPADCTDGITGAYWWRPKAYLDGRVRAGMSPRGGSTRTRLSGAPARGTPATGTCAPSPSLLLAER